jgi:hypothetical protein
MDAFTVETAPYWIAVLCVIGGFAMIYLGFVLSSKEIDLKKEIDEGVKKATELVETAKELAAPTTAETRGIGEGVRAQTATSAVSGATEYVKGLAELAKSLTGLSPAIAAFIIATILFFLAATLAGVTTVTE